MNKDGASFVKLIARYMKDEDRVNVTSCGIESSGNTSVDETQAIDHGLVVYGDPDHQVMLSSHGTDAGGGGTR